MGYRRFAVLSFVLSPISWAQVTSVITAPAPGETIAQIYEGAGTVASTAGDITNVDISMDGGPYSPVSTLFGMPPGSWVTGVYAKLMPAGMHTMQVRATDANGNIGFSPVVNFNVVHSNPVCSHTQVAAGIYCEKGATAVQGATASITYTGETAGQLIFVTVDTSVPPSPGPYPNGLHLWTTDYISNTLGYTWTLLNNFPSGILDMNAESAAIFYAYVPNTTDTPDVITLHNPDSTGGHTFLASVIYSGVAGPPVSYSIKFGLLGSSPGVVSSGPFSSSIGNLNIGLAGGAPTGIAQPGWTERVEDASRPYIMFFDQIASGASSTFRFHSNPEGWSALGVSFRPARQKNIPTGLRRF
jgi:hypothetical protein